jgi:hypothetical protein
MPWASDSLGCCWRSSRQLDQSRRRQRGEQAAAGVALASTWSSILSLMTGGPVQAASYQVQSTTARAPRPSWLVHADPACALPPTTSVLLRPCPFIRLFIRLALHGDGESRWRVLPHCRVPKRGNAACRGRSGPHLQIYSIKRFSRPTRSSRRSQPTGLRPVARQPITDVSKPSKHTMLQPPAQRARPTVCAPAAVAGSSKLARRAERRSR